MTSGRAEWRGMRPALKRQDKGCMPNASTVIPHLHQQGILTESPKRRATPIQGAVVDESADYVVGDAVQPGARLRKRCRLETGQTMLVK